MLGKRHFLDVQFGMLPWEKKAWHDTRDVLRFFVGVFLVLSSLCGHFEFCVHSKLESQPNGAWLDRPVDLFLVGSLCNPLMITSTSHGLECTVDWSERLKASSSLFIRNSIYLHLLLLIRFSHFVVRSGRTARPREHPAYHPGDP